MSYDQARDVLDEAHRRVDAVARRARRLRAYWPPLTPPHKREAKVIAGELRRTVADLKLACLVARDQGIKLNEGENVLADLAEFERGLVRGASSDVDEVLEAEAASRNGASR